MGLRDRGIEIKTPEQIDADASRRAGRRARPSSCCATRSRPGVTHRRARRARRGRHPRPRRRPRPSWATTASPASICASVNDEVVHGIPGDRVLAEGDVVSIDCGAIVDGWHGDAAITVAGRRGAPTSVTRADAGHRGRRCGAASRRRGSAAGSPTSPTRSRRTSASPGRLRHPRGLHRPRHRHRDAPAARRAQLRPPRPRAQAGARARAGRRADGHPRHPRDRPRSRTTGPWSPSTALGGALRAHLHRSPPTGAWVLTALDGGAVRLGLAASRRVPFGVGAGGSFPMHRHTSRTGLVGRVTAEETSGVTRSRTVAPRRRRWRPIGSGRRRTTPTRPASVVREHRSRSTSRCAVAVRHRRLDVVSGPRYARGVLRRLADGVLPLDRQPVHLHHHHEQVRGAARATSRRAARSASSWRWSSAAIFIAVGAAAINQFSWVFYLFGLFLVCTAITLAREGARRGRSSTTRPRLVRFVRRHFRVSEEWHGTRLFERVSGKRVMTPMFLVILALGMTDLLFALDSIPAIYGLTRSPTWSSPPTSSP